MLFVCWVLPDYLRIIFNKLSSPRMDEYGKDAVMSTNRLQLRALTYMYPGHPMEIYEGLIEYLEEVTGAQISLQHEWRSSDGRPDVFKNNIVDIAFMSATQYVNLVDAKNPYVELLPVTPVFKHPKNNSERPGYYADIIVHVDKMKKHFADKLLDLRGCRWAYSDAESFSSAKVLLNRLNDLGENASFFGNTLRSGSHLASLKMVLGKQAEAASIDATTLQAYAPLLPDNAKDVLVLDSIGPLAPYPIVINNRLPDDLKITISRALLNLRYKEPRFAKYGLLKFVANHPDAYMDLKTIRKAVENKSFTIPYY